MLLTHQQALGLVKDRISAKRTSLCLGVMKQMFQGLPTDQTKSWFRIVTSPFPNPDMNTIRKLKERGRKLKALAKRRKGKEKSPVGMGITGG